MGVLNVTPDSFSDGGRYLDPAVASAHALELVADGADIIDVGGESSRPGAEPVDASEEMARVIPVIEAIRSASEVAISIDTTKAEVARMAIEAGADIVNDISALRSDPAMVEVVAASGAGLVMMHMQGEPRTMQLAPSYNDVVREVQDFLKERIASAENSGIDPASIAIDPGIGFGKTVEHNVALIKGLPALVQLGPPVLIGPSNKAFIGKILDLDVADRLEGTAAVVAIGVSMGARIVRVHDVKQISRVVRMTEALVST